MTRRIPDFLQNKDLRLLLFGGKGGVGKTTMAAASALYLAGSRGEDRKVLVISTDPAHSLSDSFEMEIGDRVTGIQGSGVGGQESEGGSQESGVGGQGSEGGGQESEGGSQESGVGGQESEGGSQESEGGSQESGVGGQGSEGGSQESGVGGQGSEVRAKTRIECPQSKIQKPKSKSQNLFALELDAGRLLDEFKEKNHDVIMKLAERGTYFDEEDIAGLFDLSLPGMDEVMAIMEIADLLKTGSYDLIIVDTAPTGHTVRMLNLPEQMLAWIETVELMQHKHRYLSEVFSGKKYRKDLCDGFLDDLSSGIDQVRRLLSDEETTRFVPVMIPEPMSIYETERLIGSLGKAGVPAREIIVNHVAESDGCVFCRARKKDQEIPLKEIEDRFPAYDRIRIPVFPHEIRGISGLNSIAEALSGMRAPLHSLKRVEMVDAPAGCLTLDSGLEFVLFGGKGGVGKTTLASAAALHLAQRHPAKRVLLFSTDPAHSLSDSLNQPIGDEMTSVQSPKSKVQGRWNDHRMTMNDGRRPNDVSVERPKSKVQSQMTNDQCPMTNLYALEIDADRLWGDFKEAFKNDIAALFDRFVARGADIRFDREAMTEIIELAPPGVDEIMALSRIMDLRNEGEFDIFVLDTSPTGHLLRFLELPDLVRAWLKAFFGLLLKYKGVVSLAGAAEKALALSKNVRRIQETLTDPERTDFVATTIPEAMAISELERLMLALQAGNIPCRHIVVNKAVPETDCGFCTIKRAEQQDYVRKIASMFPDRTIVQAPLFPRQIRGIEDLSGLGDAVFCSNDHE